jgi:hypothetical protein
MRYDLLRRFVAKVFHDVLPAALASLLGGFLLTHYGFGRPPQPAPVQAAPASAEMMDLLRDEHALVVNYLTAHMANEKKQALALAIKDDVSADAADRTADEPTAATEAPRPPAVATIAAKPAAPRGKTQVVGASLPPLMVAQEQPGGDIKVAAPNDDSLKTIKDHVLAVTQRAVSVIGGIPSWIGAIGDRIGGESEVPRPPANLVSAS